MVGWVCSSDISCNCYLVIMLFSVCFKSKYILKKKLFVETKIRNKKKYISKIRLTC